MGTSLAACLSRPPDALARAAQAAAVLAAPAQARARLARPELLGGAGQRPWLRSPFLNSQMIFLHLFAFFLHFLVELSRIVLDYSKIN